MIEEFGGREYCIRAVPANLYGLGEQEVFIELLDSVMEENVMADMDLITDKIASMACKAAVKRKSEHQYTGSRASAGRIDGV